MNFTCNRELFLNSVSLLNTIIPNKTQARPILSNIRVEVIQDEMILSCTDLQMGCKYTIPLISSLEDGIILLPSSQLTGILREAEGEEIRLERSGRTAIISNIKTQYKLPSFSDEDYPEVPELEGESLELDKKILARLFGEVSFAMTREKNRFALDSLLLCLLPDRMEAVATDQIRLAYAKESTELNVTKEEKFILPAKAVNVLSTVLAMDDNEKIRLIRGKSQITFAFANGYFITRLVDAQFPNYRGAYESFTSEQGFEMATAKMATAIRQILLLTCDNAKNVALILEKDLMVFKASTPLGEGKVEIPIEYQGNPQVVGINPFFVQDFLKEASSQNIEKVILRVLGSNKPVVLSAHENYTYFMSPTNI